MSAYDDIAVNSASSTRQADRYRKAVEQEMASPSGTTYVGAYAMFHDEQRHTCAVHVLGWISMLLSFLLLILWVVISFFAGVALQVFADVREAGPYLIGYLVVSILAAVLYLLMTLFVAVFTCRAPFCGCARSTVVKPSLCSVLTFVLLFLLSCVLSVLAGVSIKDALTAGKIRDPVIAAFVFMILCTVVFMIYFILWSVRGAPRE